MKKPVSSRLFVCRCLDLASGVETRASLFPLKGHVMGKAWVRSALVDRKAGLPFSPDRGDAGPVTSVTVASGCRWKGDFVGFSASIASAPAPARMSPYVVLETCEVNTDMTGKSPRHLGSDMLGQPQKYCLRTRPNCTRRAAANVPSCRRKGPRLTCQV